MIYLTVNHWYCFNATYKINVYEKLIAQLPLFQNRKMLNLMIEIKFCKYIMRILPLQIYGGKGLSAKNLNTPNLLF